MRVSANLFLKYFSDNCIAKSQNKMFYASIDALSGSW